MKTKLISVAVILTAFTLTAVAQPTGPQQSQNQTPDRDQLGERNQTQERDRNMSVNESAPRDSAQFDARLRTAINTLDVLVKIAPSEEARTELQEAKEILEGVQEDTDTASLGPAGNQTDNNQSKQGPPEEKGPQNGNSGQESKGQGQGNRPGFVGSIIGGIFG